MYNITMMINNGFYPDKKLPAATLRCGLVLRALKRKGYYNHG